MSGCKNVAGFILQENINLLFYKSVQTLKENPIRAANALQVSICFDCGDSFDSEHYIANGQGKS